MQPFSRGKRILEMSLSNLKKDEDVKRNRVQDEDKISKCPSSNQDVCKKNDVGLLQPLSSTIKVAHFILDCTDRVEEPEFSGVKNPSVEKRDGGIGVLVGLDSEMRGSLDHETVECLHVQSQQEMQYSVMDDVNEVQVQEEILTGHEDGNKMRNEMHSVYEYSTHSRQEQELTTLQDVGSAQENITIHVGFQDGNTYQKCVDDTRGIVSGSEFENGDLVKDKEHETHSVSEPEDVEQSQNENIAENRTLDDDNPSVPKKRRVNERRQNQKKREQGMNYTGRHLCKDGNKYVSLEQPARTLQPSCNCKASYHQCKDVTEEERKKIFDMVWSMTWDEKANFVKLLIDVNDVKERKTDSEISRRTASLTYHLKTTTQRLRVCKTMFQNTTGLRQWWILSKVGNQIQEPSHGPEKTISLRSEKAEFLTEFLKSLAKMPSHYCRASTSREYLEPVFGSYAELYDEYRRVCVEKSKEPLTRPMLMKVFKDMNLGLFQPRKDRCDTCCSFEAGNISEEDFEVHRALKARAQFEKAEDKKTASIPNSAVTLITVDLQRVLLAPSLKASALYYKTKLKVHNYTIFDLSTKQVTCYVWNETAGGLTASEFATCLMRHLEKNLKTEKCIIYSDGCTYQNRNTVLATALRLFSVTHKKTIEQKFLERGHTQMEVDSVHATIERKICKKSIFSPVDYVKYIQEARKQPEPYTVEYLNHTFFLDFKTFGDLKSIRPGKKTGDPNVTDIKAIRYNPDGSIDYKLNFDNAWMPLPLGRNIKLPSGQPSSLYSARLKIDKSKFDHLQSMKTVIPEDYHAYFDAIPHK